MACACNKNRATPTPKQTAAKTADGEARKQTSTRTLSTPTVQPMRGTQQSFALQAGDKTGRFGSRLERDAAAARIPGSRAV